MIIKVVLAFAVFTMTANRGGRLLLTLYALQLGAQPLAVGILAAMFSIFPSVFSMPVGMLADRLGSRLPLLCGSAGMTLGLMVPYLFPGMPAMYIASAFMGMSFAFYNVTMQNLVGLMSEPQHRTRNFNNFSLTQAVGFFSGPVVAGFGIDHAGYGLTCLYLALLSLVPVVALVIWGGMLPGGTRNAKTSSGNIMHVLRDRGLLRVLVIGSLVITGIELFQFYMPIYGYQIGLSASAIGIVISMFAAAAFVIRLTMSTLLKWWNEEQLLAYSFYLSAASIVMIPFFENVAVLALISFVFGLGTGCGQPITMKLTFGGSAQGRSGEILGLRISINQFTRVIIPILFGTIGSVAGLFPVFGINALMLVAGGLLSRPKNADK